MLLEFTLTRWQQVLNPPARIIISAITLFGGLCALFFPALAGMPNAWRAGLMSAALWWIVWGVLGWPIIRSLFSSCRLARYVNRIQISGAEIALGHQQFEWVIKNDGYWRIRRGALGTYVIWNELYHTALVVPKSAVKDLSELKSALKKVTKSEIESEVDAHVEA